MSDRWARPGGGGDPHRTRSVTPGAGQAGVGDPRVVAGRLGVDLPDLTPLGGETIPVTLWTYWTCRRTTGGVVVDGQFTGAQPQLTRRVWLGRR